MPLKNFIVGLVAGLLVLSCCLPGYCGLWTDPYIQLFREGKTQEILVRARAVRDQKPNDVQSWIVFAYVAKACGATREARDAYLHIAKTFPNSKMASYSVARAGQLKKDLDSMPDEIGSKLSVDDYCLVDRVVDHGYFRWTKSRIPLKVYCATDAGLDSALMKQLVNESCRSWESGAKDIISFVETADKNAADIEILFTADLNHKKVDDSAGNTSYTRDSKTGNLTHTSITVLTSNHYTGRPRPPGDIKYTIIHELGHSLGLNHSKDPMDIMYFSGHFAKPTSVPSDRDLRLLHELYAMSSEEMFQKVIGVVSQAGGAHSPIMVKIYDHAGYAAMHQDDVDNSLEWFRKASDLAEALKLEKDQAARRRYNYVGNLYYRQNKFDQAAVFYQKYCAMLKPTDPSRVRTQKTIDWCLRHVSSPQGSSTQGTATQGTAAQGASNQGPPPFAKRVLTGN